MPSRDLTIQPYDLPGAATNTDVLVSLELVDSSGAPQPGYDAVSGTGVVGTYTVTIRSSAVVIALPSTEGLTPSLYWRFKAQWGSVSGLRLYTSGLIELESAGGALTLPEFLSLAEIPGTITGLTADELAAIRAANAADVDNPFATLADIVAGGGGNVSKVGTPVNNQVGVWTGDGSIEGDANLTFDGSNLSVGGNIVVGGTVDGRDLATDGTKLDGVEAAADVTDTINVTAAGALMDSEVDADLKTFSLPADTTISAFGATLADAADAATARATLGVGAGSGDVAKVGTPVNNQVGVWTGDGTLEGTAALTFDGAALDITGNITVSGTVDGRDLATDGTKLDTVEANADATDAANVTSAGAVMDSEVASLSGVKTLTVPNSTTLTAAAATVTDDATVSAMVDTLGGASSTGTGGLVRATSPTLVTPVLGGDLDCAGNDLTDVQRIILDATPDADHTATGPSTNTINAGTTIAAFELCYLASDGEWALADASATATTNKFLSVALEAGTDGNPMDVSLPGSFIRDDTWTWTVGGAIYAGVTAGAMTQADEIDATDEVARVVGYAISADVMWFSPETGVVHS